MGWVSRVVESTAGSSDAGAASPNDSSLAPFSPGDGLVLSEYHLDAIRALAGAGIRWDRRRGCRCDEAGVRRKEDIDEVEEVGLNLRSTLRGIIIAVDVMAML